MARREWRHPRHNRPAAAAVICNCVSLLFIFIAVFVVHLFIDERQGSKAKYTMIEKKVNCDGDECKEEGELASWQTVSIYLLLISLVFNSLSVVLQAFVLWPMITLGKVNHIIMRLAQVADSVGAPPKFLVAFVYVYHISEINHMYASENPKRHLLEMCPLPLVFINFSFILEILSFMGLTLALDSGPRGGPTYWEIIDEEEKAKDLTEPEIYRRASYMPDVKETHSRILSSTQMAVEEVPKHKPKNWLHM